LLIMASESDVKIVPVDVVHKFVKDCVVRAGAKESHGTDLADLLTTADHRGHFSHGLNRLEIYVNDLVSGIMDKEGEPTIEKESVSTALVNGNNLLGPAIGKFCMRLAIKKAKETGIGMVTCHKSNHYGIAGYYSLMAGDEGLIGMSFTNTSPLVVPTRARECAYGTNPIAFTSPCGNHDDFTLDMATSTVAVGKIELQKRKGDKMPRGWGADRHGNETDEPGEVLEGGGLLPLGGAEECGGYKGYGLAMMVEILCASLSGATYGKNVRKWGSTDRIADLGQCFIAINPEMFAPGFQPRMDDLMRMVRNLVPSHAERPVLVAGDPERDHMKKCAEIGGIPYHKNVVAHMNLVGKKLSIPPM